MDFFGSLYTSGVNKRLLNSMTNRVGQELTGVGLGTDLFQVCGNEEKYCPERVTHDNWYPN
jgi:hypothetical protein